MPDKRIIMHNPDRHPQHMSNQTQKIPVGWCSHNKHRGKLSVRQMKQHKCIAKQCQFFTKNERHIYWQQQEQKKQNKRLEKQKARLSEYFKEEINSALNKILNAPKD
jgi:hypothetical protein